MKSFSTLKVVAVSLLLVACSNKAEQDAKAHYDYVRSVVQSSLHHDTSQFCIRGASLTIVGQRDMAEQYRHHFGDCIDNAVAKAQVILGGQDGNR